MNFLIVFFGAGICGAARHGVNMAVSGSLLTQFPYATLIINVMGSFLMGAVAGYFALKSYLPQHWRLFLTTGILGGFTTFSAFSLEAVLLYERGAIELAAIYVAASACISILALFASLALVRTLVEVTR